MFRLPDSHTKADFKRPPHRHGVRPEIGRVAIRMTNHYPYGFFVFPGTGEIHRGIDPFFRRRPVYRAADSATGAEIDRLDKTLSSTGGVIGQAAGASHRKVPVVFS
ncbi:hypothetical protein Sme01_09610 [Sphaerisporangium melleum]|uniref:Uncharacterized protein n=1 Tax=Sphaerisporangium melleum TaxID=321316 RepID=A0A917QT65_9ACTN|nr:hypothetical protein [Sphaerisporangium melleum]GGK67349.1 hypothetical protein GCM10007964_08000 [Sphaerisporangium melleum]GII68485.1 hypothetical protein Sme01_09610 [Sphaerisporangium melleum]